VYALRKKKVVMATIRKIRSGKWFVEIRKQGYPNISKAILEISI
jgi:hypothetical protein